MDYQQQALDFLQSTNTKFSVKFLDHAKYFDDDDTTRDIYEITIARNGRKFVFKFGQSIMKSQYYKDKIEGRTYTLNGGCRTGNYSITNIEKYLNGGMNLTLVQGEAPTLYDVLACLQKYDVGTFEDFCGEFGYDTDSRKAFKTYKAVIREYKNLERLYSEAELEQLREIN